MSTSPVVNRAEAIVNSAPSAKQKSLTESLISLPSYGTLSKAPKSAEVMNAKDVLQLHPEWEYRYPQLVESLTEKINPETGKNSNKYSTKVADATLVCAHNTYERFMENMNDVSFYQSSGFQKNLSLLNKVLKADVLSNYISESTQTGKMTESTITTTNNVYNPAYSVVDMMGVTYPGSVLHNLTDVMPIPQKWNKAFRLMPRFSDNGGGVTANEIIFQNPTDGYYASTFRTANLTGQAGNTGPFNIPLPDGPVAFGSVYITLNAGGTTYIVQDDGAGNLVCQQNPALLVVGSSVIYDNASSQGLVTFSTTIPISVAPLDTIVVGYDNDYQNDTFMNSDIRSVFLDYETLDLQAQANPLRITVSQEMEFEIKSLSDTSCVETLQQVAVGLLSNERDIRYMNNIRRVAVYNPALDFQASSLAYPNIALSAVYSLFELKVNMARSLIQNSMGRGDVSTLIVGTQAADILMYCPSFEASDIRNPIGPYLFGTLQNGAVSIIKNPYMAVNEYVIYFKGYTAVDAPILHADWIPFYVTDKLQMYDFNNYQAFASWYTQVKNPWVTQGVNTTGGYVWKGLTLISPFKISLIAGNSLELNYSLV